MYLIVLDPTSDTYTLPLGSTAMPYGVENEADVPAPSMLLFVPLPARVLTTPAAEMTRTRLFPESAT
jgi:hypothetical protein